MNAEIFAALRQLEKERGIPVDYMVEKITQALVAAYKKDRDGYTDNVYVELTEDAMRMYAQKEVVDEVITPATEVTLDAARKVDPHAQLGDLVNVEIKTQAFGRIAAQTAKQVIIQGIREAERGMIFESFSSKEHEILTGSVLRFEPNGDMTIRIGQGTDKTDALLPVGEQVKTEHFVEGDMIRVYVIEVRRSSRGPQVMVSRTHPALVKRLFELEVPEISSGAVEIRSIAREPGSRTKIAVHAAEENIDPVGACVGARGARVGAVVEELQGEKMDIVVWAEAICQSACFLCLRAGRSAVAFHLYVCPYRPPRRAPDRLQDRHQARLAGRGAGRSSCRIIFGNCTSFCQIVFLKGLGPFHSRIGGDVPCRRKCRCVNASAAAK